MKVIDHIKNDPKRQVIRFAIAALFAGAFYFAFIAAEPPSPLPTVALGQGFLYRVELLLATVFAALLLLTPLLQGVLNGRLPTEITARGAKYEEVSDSLKAAETRIGKLEETLASTAAAAFAAKADIDQLRKQLEGS